MTPEERFEHIEQAIVQIVDIQREQAEVQRDQADVQRNQARIVRDHATLLSDHATLLSDHATLLSDHATAQRNRAHFEDAYSQKMLEVTEKLDALIEVVDKVIKRNGH
jgi:hypothetical protein